MALKEVLISKYIRSIILVIVSLDFPTQTAPRTTARFPTLPNFDVCDLYEPPSYNNFLEFFCVSLTFHLSITLAKDQLPMHKVFNTFITILYMYMVRAISCSSSGGQIVLTLILLMWRIG